MGVTNLEKKDLKGMTRKELEKLLTDVKKALQAAKARDQRAAKKAAAKAAAQFGFSLGELSEAENSNGKRVKKTRKKASRVSEPVFANPENKQQTWTGKGRQPTWFRTHVSSGVDPDSMRI